jgi:hypothetical protein
MPATATAPTAAGAEAACPENRVKALDVLTWPRVGVRSLDSPDRCWENRPWYDGKAVGTVLARYYDPASAQFLTVDPKVSTTLSPYGYVAGDPVNASDPTGKGLCFIWQSNCQSAAQRVSSFVSHLCIRTGGGDWDSNDNGSCQTVLSGRQGVQLIGATLVTAAGTVATLGLGDVVFAGIAGDFASGTLLGAVNAGIGIVGAWSILGVPALVGGIGVFWGVSALGFGSGGCDK